MALLNQLEVKIADMPGKILCCHLVESALDNHRGRSLRFPPSRLLSATGENAVLLDAGCL